MIKRILFLTFICFILLINILIYINIKNYINILNDCFNQHIFLTSELYLFICVIIAFISILIVLDIFIIFTKRKEENKGINFKTEDGTHGTSDWMKTEEIEQILSINDVPGIVLGKFNNQIVKLPCDSYFNKNICVFGSSGSMKTTAFLLTNLLEISKYMKSIIVTDPKTDIYRITSNYFKKIGYIVKVFNLKDMCHSDRWNPLAENENINDIQTSANVIISNTQKKSGKDEFWPRAEENLLKAFLFYFLQILVDKNNLTNIYKKIAAGDLSEIDAMFKGLPNEHPAKMSYNIFASGSDTIKASVITGLGTRLQAFQNEDLQKLTAESDIDLTLPAKKPCIYYIMTDDMNSSYDFLSSLFYTFLFIKLVRYADSRPNGRCDNEVYCFLDEFANIGQIPDFNKKISTVRSRGIALLPIIQNLGQLENRYPNEQAQEIIGNCDIILGFGTSDTLTAKYFCDLLGVSTIEVNSIKKDNSIEGDFLEYGQKNISTTKRNLLNIDEILRLPSNKALVIIRGNRPLLLDKLRYSELSLSKELKDCSILDYIPDWIKNNLNNSISYDENKKVEKAVVTSNEDITWENF